MEGLFKHTPLRILMITDTVGGVWSYSMELCNALRDFNVQFCLITTGAPLQEVHKEELKMVRNVTVYETDFLLEWMESPWESMDASAAWLLQLEESLQPDFIHLNGYAYGSLPWKAPVIVVAHSDVWSWWLSVKGEQPPTAWNEYYQRVNEGLKGADYLVAPSKTMMDYIREIYDFPTPGGVIYNGKKSEHFYPAEKEPFVIGIGRIWDEAKNIQLLIDAAPHIRYPIKLAGDNSFAGNNVTTTGTNVSYLGKLSPKEVATHLSFASLYVLPAKYEPFGLSILEAALSGCVLVLGDIDSLKEIWEDSAIYVDTHNANALAGTVNNLMNDKAMRTHYAQRALEQAAKYTTTAMAANYLQVYRKLLQPEEQLLQQEIM